MNRERMYQMLTAYTASKPAYDTRDLKPVIEALRDEIIAAEAKKSGRTGYLKAAKHIIKNVDDIRPQFRGTLTRPDGFYFCDGFRALKLPDDVGLPEAEYNPDYPFRIENIFDDLTRFDDLEPLDLPTAAELKILITEYKAAHKRRKGYNKYPVYTFPAADIDIHAEYLYNIVANLPGCTAGRRPSQPLGPIYLTDGTAEAIILPLRR